MDNAQGGIRVSMWGGSFATLKIYDGQRQATQLRAASIHAAPHAIPFAHWLQAIRIIEQSWCT